MSVPDHIDRSGGHTAVDPRTARDAERHTSVPTDRDERDARDGAERDARDDAERTSVLRVPTFSPLAVLIGAVAAWGTVVITTAILERIGIGTGFNLGLADGGAGDSGFWPGLWLLVTNGGAFVLGGYTAARMARANGTRHAVLVWVLAMAATAADAIIETMRDGAEGVVRLVPGVPFWSEHDLTGRGDAVLVLALFAAISLVGAFVGGGLGQTANRIDRTDDAIVAS